MHPFRPTKNDSYSFLVKEGVKRGFEVIPEYRVTIPKTKKNKSIDLVWATRQVGAAKYQDCESERYWGLVATFEIEGCNVNIRKEFDRHLRDLPCLNHHFASRPAFHSIVLYTAAFDRSALRAKHLERMIHERREAAKAYGIHVFSVDDVALNEWLPK